MPSNFWHHTDRAGCALAQTQSRPQGLCQPLGMSVFKNLS